MTRNLRRFFIAIPLFVCFSFSAYAAPETFTLDPTHTYVMWHVSHFGFSNPSGKWMTGGTLILDQQNPKNSQVNTDIQMDTLDTGVSELDKHLKDKAFFNVDEFPDATFTSNKVKVIGKNKALVSGILTLHGVAKPVTLHVTLNKLAVSPITNKLTAGFSATAKLKRSDFGITAFMPGISDDVTLDIQAEAAQNS